MVGKPAAPLQSNLMPSRKLIPTLALAFAITAIAAARAEAELDFNRDVRPILSENCFACHGFDPSSRKAELRLDTREGATAEVIVPGKPEESELIARIQSSDADELMPPAESHKKPLGAAAIATLEEWIRQGAPWGEHWAFVKPDKPALPAGVNPIDHLVRSSLEAEGLEMSPPAAGHTLRRRLSFDLIGLPLTPGRAEMEVDMLVDELLASPHFGERMAMWWLDGARYSDTDGFQADATRSNWPWRDWVIDAFNANMPFDQFTIEQFAGDLLPDAKPEQVLATCFHRNHMTNGEGGRDPAESRVDYVLDRTNTTGTLFLGLTLGCTQCHDHKFDPISQVDYYSLSAYFDNIDEDGQAGGNAKPYLAYRSPYAARAAAEMRALFEESGSALGELRKSRFAAFEDWLAAQSAAVGAGFEPWRIIRPAALATKEGAQLREEAGEPGVIQLHGAAPVQDDFTIAVDHPGLGRITGVRLEAFPHGSLTDGKLSPAEDGEFILTNFKLGVRDEGSTQLREVALSKAVADVNGKGRDEKYANVSGTLDDDPRTGWTTRNHPADSPHRAVFELAEPLVLGDGETLEIVLMHRSLEERALIGRFRLALTDQRGDAVRSLAKMPLEELAAGAAPEGELRQRLLDQFLEDDTEFQAAADRHAELKRQLNELDKATGPQKVMVLAEREQRRQTYVLQRGVWDAHGEEVGRAVLPAVSARDGVDDRLALARWIVSADNPLTARVISNQIWQLMFGAGLVRTPGDFGVQGEAPTHPELLDWLAVELVESGWDIKHLVKTIVSSATYRQSSLVSPEMLERDPQNRLLARGARFRLPAWMLRDSLLAYGGLLNPAHGGPPVFPYQPPGIWNDQFMGRFTYRPSLGAAAYRRTVYAFWRRSSAPTFLFDNAMRRSCEVTPRRTNTPLHALTMLNDKTSVEAARALAAYGIPEIFRRVLSREPSAAELAVCQRQREKALAFYREDAAAAREFSGGGDAERAAMTLVANLILNLDEALTHE